MHTHALMFIQDLAIIMMIASVSTIICSKLKQPLVIGYILTGIIIGPHTPPFTLITNETTIATLAELGVIFLMFSLGLEFNLRKLNKVGLSSAITATIEIVVMTTLGYAIGLAFGWSQMSSLFLGALLAISSTTIIVKALDELNLKKNQFAQLIFGILVIEDIFAILILTLLSSMALTGTLETGDILKTSIKLSSFLVFSLTLGILIIPKVLNYVTKIHNSEVLLTAILGLCLGFCLIVIKLNYSAALGAFIIGAIIAEFRQLQKIEHLIKPIKDMFSCIFFVSVGLLFNPNILVDYFLPIVCITLIVVFGKIISCTFGALLSGHDGKTSMRVGMGMAQIGEFSFIIAALGISLKVTDNFLYSIAVCVSIITTILTPYLIRYSDFCSKHLANFIPKNISATFSVYTRWIKNLNREKDSQILNTVKRSIVHIIINLFIVIAIFLAGAYISTTDLGIFLYKITNTYIKKTIIWASALLISLPFLIAAYRKIKALSMMLAEISIKNTKKKNTDLNVKARKIISEIIPVLALLAIMFLISLLSAGILPPMELILIILLLAAILAVVILPWLIRIHSRLQISLMKTFKKNEDRD